MDSLMWIFKARSGNFLSWKHNFGKSGLFKYSLLEILLMYISVNLLLNPLE
jgi:hypothetical protein